jgi:uncharacterized protein involved in tolerance to divalent cations
MRILYVTLNTAPQISRGLLEQQLAVCINWLNAKVPACASSSLVPRTIADSQ